MKVAVFGAGGVGGYFGGLLAQAGHEVSFIARGEHLAAMQARGLQVHSPHGDFHLQRVVATDDSARVGPADYLIVALKHYHLPAAAPRMRPLVGPQTTTVPLLNGVDAHEVLIEALGPESVVGGLCSIVSMVEAPGVIRQVSQMRRVVVGELDRQPSERVARLVQAWAACGVEALQPPDIFVEMWRKYLFIASFGGVSSLARVPLGELLHVPQTRGLLQKAMREVEALARAQEIPLPADVVEAAFSLLESFEPQATSSMQRDVAAGRPFELEAFSGKIAALGRSLGVPTPVHEAIEALLRPQLEGVLQAG